MALPRVLDGGRAVLQRVRSIDIAPTVLDLEGLEADPRMSGLSVLPLARGVREPEPRVVVSEDPDTQAILWSHFRLVTNRVRDRSELFDLDADPGERRDLAGAEPDLVAEMQARLTAALANTPAADAVDPGPPKQSPITHLRFSGAGRVRAIQGQLTVGEEHRAASFQFEPIGAPRSNFRAEGPTLTFSLVTSPDALVGFDIWTDPRSARVVWTFFLDGGGWPAHATFSGPFGLPAVASSGGLATIGARSEAYAWLQPFIDPVSDLGVFITRDHPGIQAVDKPHGTAQTRH
jgi:hypothetical protein